MMFMRCVCVWIRIAFHGVSRHLKHAARFLTAVTVQLALKFFFANIVEVKRPRLKHVK